jgi:hypothetical protein
VTSGATPGHSSAYLSEDAFARLFDGLQEGVYIGLAGRAEAETATLAANPHLRLMFGWDDDVPVAEVKPFEGDRFVDRQARAEFLQQLTRDGIVRGYLARLVRLDGSVDLGLFVLPRKRGRTREASRDRNRNRTSPHALTSTRPPLGARAGSRLVSIRGFLDWGRRSR